MKKTFAFAGVGPRNTPSDVLAEMTAMGELFASLNWIGCSGFGQGADQAWLEKVPHKQQEVWLPWGNYNRAQLDTDKEKRFRILVPTEVMNSIASKHYAQNWNAASQGVRLLMMRNVAIMLGNHGNQPVDLVAYWQSEENEFSMFGGTNHGIRVAVEAGIPCFNIRKQKDVDAMSAFVEKLMK